MSRWTRPGYPKGVLHEHGPFEDRARGSLGAIVTEAPTPIAVVTRDAATVHAGALPRTDGCT